MNKYMIDFSLEGFDDSGEEHRLTTYCVHEFRPDFKHRGAARNLIAYAAKLLRLKPDQVALRTVKIKSVWLHTDGGKRLRVPARELIQSLVTTGEIAPKGREGGRVDTRNTPLGRRMRR